MATNVYWSHFEDYLPDVLWDEPEPLFSNLKNGRLSDYRLKDRIFKCPSFRDSIRNTFVIKSPIDFKVTWREDGTVDGEVSRLVEPDLRPFWQLISGDALILLADRSLDVTVFPAYMHNDLNFPSLSGTYDCGRWFRQVQATYYFEPGTDFEVKQGDALYYIKFHTKDRIKFKRYKMTDVIKREAHKNGVIKRFKSFPTLAKLYDWYDQTNRVKFLLRQIKDNLC